jgi:hypothetical protein
MKKVQLRESSWASAPGKGSEWRRENIYCSESHNERRWCRSLNQLALGMGPGQQKPGETASVERSQRVAQK